MAPAIGAEQAKLGRGARIHSLGVPAVTPDMSGARLNVESGRTQCRRLQLRSPCGVGNSVCEAGEPRALALLRACCGST